MALGDSFIYHIVFKEISFTSSIPSKGAKKV